MDKRKVFQYAHFTQELLLVNCSSKYWLCHRVKSTKTGNPNLHCKSLGISAIYVDHYMTVREDSIKYFPTCVLYYSLVYVESNSRVVSEKG